MTRAGHQLLHGVHAQLTKKGIHGIDLRRREGTTLWRTHLNGSVGFELHQNLTFTKGLLIPSINLDNLVFIVRTLREQTRCSQHHRCQKEEFAFHKISCVLFVFILPAKLLLFSEICKSFRNIHKKFYTFDLNIWIFFAGIFE